MLGDTSTVQANYSELICTWLRTYFVDINYAVWLFYLFETIVFIFVFQYLFLAILIVGCTLFLHIYKLINYLRGSADIDMLNQYSANTIISWFFVALGWILNGHEVIGWQYIPDTGPALIIAYHGSPVPVVGMYFVAECHVHKKRLIYSVADKMFNIIPCLKGLMKILCISAGTVDSCTEILKEGHLLFIIPGGAREAFFSDSDKYDLVWNDRLGFAKAAIRAKAPIIPMFTENSREFFRTPAWARRWLRNYYERTRLLFFPVYGGFPVKWRTYLGPPIPYQPDVSPEELRDRTKAAIEKLILSYQQLPGSVLRALLDRIAIFRRPKSV